jgi:hypothetical protein
MKNIVNKIAVASFVFGITGSAAATNEMVGGDEGHGNATCNIQPFNLTPSVSCSNSSAASGSYNWQITLPTHAASSSTVVTVSAIGRAFVPVVSGSAPTQTVGGRLLAWHESGILMCSTAGATWGQFSSPLPLILGACSVTPANVRAEAEFGVGHRQGQARSLEPRVMSVIYSY